MQNIVLKLQVVDSCMLSFFVETDRNNKGIRNASHSFAVSHWKRLPIKLQHENIPSQCWAKS